MRGMTFDKERVSFNLARIKKFGNNFEVAVDPDLAIEFQGTKKGDVKEIIKSGKIFSNVKRGELAPEEQMMEAFKTTDSLEIAKIILEEGEIQLSAEYREEQRVQKRNNIIEIIRRNAIDPKTRIPIPVNRLENAFEEANVRIDDHQTPEEQLGKIIDKLRPILPIRMESKKIALKLPAVSAAKSYGIIKEQAKILREAWQNDGSLIVEIEIPAGLQNDFIDKMNSVTHGDVDIKILD